MSHVFDLFETAWSIKNANMNLDEAREKFFGKIIEGVV
jgi:hypothetical protein